jgi:hypothetical protein
VVAAISINASGDPIGLALHTPGLQPPGACNLLYGGAQSASAQLKATPSCNSRALQKPLRKR